MRIEKLATEAGVELRWRAFLLGPIFQTLGWNDSPFNIFGAKGGETWPACAKPKGFRSSCRRRNFRRTG
jgi:hypothetical protein